MNIRAMVPFVALLALRFSLVFSFKYLAEYFFAKNAFRNMSSLAHQ